MGSRNLPGHIATTRCSHARNTRAEALRFCSGQLGWALCHLWASVPARGAGIAPMRPNPSLKPSPNGKPPGPVCGALHSPQPGPGVFPLVPA